MKVISGNQFVYIDVDDTIVMWSWPKDGVEEWIELDPWENGEKVMLAINTAIVEQIKKHSARGHTVIVWSQGGWKWAETVVRALRLESYVSAVLEKPTWIYDDLEAVNFMPKAQWLGKKEWLE